MARPPKPPSSSCDGVGRGKSFMYTLNNYSDEDVERLKLLECKYHVIGKEEAPTTGTPHLQGCITFNKTLRYAAARKLIGGHLLCPEVIETARNYCMKDKDFIVIDNRKQRGTRSDLNEVTSFVKEGHTLKETALKFSDTYVKYHGGLLQLTRHMQQDAPRSCKPVVHWYYGATGLGKTRCIFDSEPELWATSDSLQYFNGYTNQRAAVFDDFRGGFCKFRELLRLLDRYPLTVNIKYGTANWNPDRIYITSNKAPDECYDKPDEDMQQLIRRIDNIVEFIPYGVDGGTVHIPHKGKFSPGLSDVVTGEAPPSTVNVD